MFPMEWRVVTYFAFIPLICGMSTAQISELFSQQLSAVKFYFHSAALPTGVDVESDEGSSSIKYDTAKPLKVIIHGWNTNRHQASIAPVLDAYLQRKQHNLLMADWTNIALLPYGVARSLAQPLGERFATILTRFMRRMNVEAGQVHVIGHSLGAHIAGQVGRHFGGQLARLTALDPAGVLFSDRSVDAYSKADALFVDAIHTDGQILGELKHRAHVDYYPNRGANQPGCELLDTLTFHSCSHYRATGYYAESIRQPYSFMATECNLENIKFHQEACTLQRTVATDFIPMGEQADQSARGTFYLETASSPPYGLGNSTHNSETTTRPSRKELMEPK